MDWKNLHDRSELTLRHRVPSFPKVINVLIVLQLATANVGDEQKRAGFWHSTVWLSAQYSTHQQQDKPEVIKRQNEGERQGGNAKYWILLALPNFSEGSKFSRVSLLLPKSSFSHPVQCSSSADNFILVVSLKLQNYPLFLIKN